MQIEEVSVTLKVSDERLDAMFKGVSEDGYNLINELETLVGSVDWIDWSTAKNHLRVTVSAEEKYMCIGLIEMRLTEWSK